MYVIEIRIWENIGWGVLFCVCKFILLTEPSINLLQKNETNIPQYMSISKLCWCNDVSFLRKGTCQNKAYICIFRAVFVKV